MRTLLSAGTVCAAMVIGAGCSAPSPTAAPPAAAQIVVQPSSAPLPSEQAEQKTATPAATVRLAPRDPAMEQWKRRAAEQIHTVNKDQLFQGRPHHLLQAVIVIEASVDRAGQVTRSRVVRSPGIKSLDQVALASLKAASPLPPPPTPLVVRGPLVFSETWLFQNDGRFQVRTLAMPQE